MWVRKLITCLLVGLAGSGCGGHEVTAPVPAPAKEVVLDGLRHPWSICFLSEAEALITEKDGDLLRVSLVDKSRRVVRGFPSDLADSIRVRDFRDNSGIFEVVKHPRYADNRLIYLSYAARGEGGTTTKIIRARLEEDSLQEVQSLFVATPYTTDLFHYGGGMVFGQDGKLYCTIGERLYNERDEPSLPIAQDVADKRGKIYRFNDDGTVPDDNPDFGPDAPPGLYATGIRAAQG
ncbi:MAG: PQQ-dependent sugar dehydrogenase, partial [Bacteroidota bacterium]